MRFSDRSIISTLAIVSLAATPLRAQVATASGTNGPTAPIALPAQPVTTGAPAAAAASLAPRADSVTAGVRAMATRPGPLPAPEPRPGDTTQNRALMIVGGAAFLVGAIIVSSTHTAGTVFMVGGALIGLYGLYKFLE